MTLKRITHARWFPVVTKPLLSGLLASAIVYGLRALGVTSVVPWEVNNAITPIVGLVVAAIAQQPTPGGPQPPGPSLGSQVAQLLLDDVKQAIDADPALFKGLLKQLVFGQTSSNRAPAPHPLEPTSASPKPNTPETRGFIG